MCETRCSCKNLEVQDIAFSALKLSAAKIHICGIFGKNL